MTRRASSSEDAVPEPRSALSAAAAALGRKGGDARRRSLTAVQRSAIARRAAKIRWAKQKKKKKPDA